MAEIPNATVLEARLERKLAGLSRRHRQELIKLLGTPPDPTNVPQSFWDRLEEETQQATLALLLLVFADSASLHGVPQAEASRIGGQWASSRAREMSRGFVDHSRQLIDKVSPAEPTTDARRRVEQALGRERAKRIAITETTIAQDAGGDEGAKKATVSLLKVWSHSGTRPARHSNAAKDPCKICSPREGFSEREVMAMGGASTIPGHPNCDCYWTYYDRATGETWPIGSPEPMILRSKELASIRQSLKN